MKKKFYIIVFSLVLVFILSGCDLLKQYTIKVHNYSDYEIYLVYYREKGQTDWINAEPKKEESTLPIGLLDPLAKGEDAFFDIPGVGTYEFKAMNLTSTIGPGSDDENIIEGEVIYDNSFIGIGYCHDISISTTSSVHGFD